MSSVERGSAQPSMQLDWWCNKSDTGGAPAPAAAENPNPPPAESVVEAWDSVQLLCFLPEDAFSDADGGAADDEAATAAAVSPPRKRARRADPGESLSRAVLSSCLKL